MQGLLLVNKSAGMTSHDVVARIRKIAKTRQVGHAGTLDPQATGLLVLAIGQATRWLDWLPSDKTYQAGMRFGLETDTQDIWGKVLVRKDASSLNAEEVNKELVLLKEMTEQIPPMVSALKKDGKKLYELAREGITVTRKARPMNIRQITILRNEPPEAEFEVACSAGTYVRTLCHDLGQTLQTGACMTSLLRTASGPFRLEQANTLEQLEKADDGLRALLKGADEALGHLPAKELNSEEEIKVDRGQAVDFPAGRGPGGQNRWRLRRGDGSLAALGLARSRGIQPDKVFKKETL